MTSRNVKRPIRRELIENELLERAADLFAERGFNGASLKDIADAMGMTRPAIYHYFDSKESLLEALVSGLTEGRARELAALRRQTDLSPIEQLRMATEIMVKAMARHPARFRLLIQSELDLPARLTEKNNKAKRDVLAQLTAIVEAGIKSGDFQATDPRLAAFAVLGMSNWVAWWFKPQQVLSAESVAEEFGRMVVAMLENRGPSAGRSRDIAGTITTLRENLDHLQGLVKDRS
jgi:AcrR family transcriptional regulator